MSPYKENKTTEYLDQSNDNTYVKVLMQKNTERTEKRKISFPKE